MPYSPLLRVAYLGRNRCSVLLAALCLFILAYPLADSRVGITVLNVCMLAIMVLAVWALRVHRLLLWLVIVLATVTAGIVVAGRLGGFLLRTAVLTTTAACIGAVTVALLFYVLDRHPITVDKVFGAVAAYVLIGFTFASVFELLQFVQPHAFHVATTHEPDGHLGWHDMLYFSLTVLTTTGFGEITAVTTAARSLIVIEQVLARISQT